MNSKPGWHMICITICIKHKPDTPEQIKHKNKEVHYESCNMEFALKGIAGLGTRS